MSNRSEALRVVGDISSQSEMMGILVVAAHDRSGLRAGHPAESQRRQAEGGITSEAVCRT